MISGSYLRGGDAAREGGRAHPLHGPLRRPDRLPNRAYFNETLVTEMVAKGDPHRLCGIAIFDLDDFKSVNDTLGHPSGTGLSPPVANFLGEFAGGRVVVGRVGGDEFTLFVNSVEHPDELGEIMDASSPNCRAIWTSPAIPSRSCSAAGGVLAKAGDFDIETMLVKADLALYSAKDAARTSGACSRASWITRSATGS
jgi:diguanylate cyclase (GGDEF)-like protein